VATLNLTEDEESYFREMRALSTDAGGRLILVGLSVEESIWFVEYHRDDLAFRTGQRNGRHSPDERRKHQELYDRHEFNRMSVIGAEHVLRTENPTRN